MMSLTQSMKRLTPRAWVFLWSSYAAALLLLTRAALFEVIPNPNELIVCGLIGILLVLATTHPIRLTHNSTISLTISLELALLLMVRQDLALWTCAIYTACTAQWHLSHSKKWYTVVFNAANTLLSVVAGSQAYRLLSGGQQMMADLHSLAAAFVAGVCYAATTFLLTAAMIALAQGGPALHRFREASFSAAPQSIALVGLGVAIAAAYAVSPVAAALLLFPMGGVYLAVRASLSLRAETKRALEDMANRVDAYHPYTYEHSERVTYYAERLVQRLNLTREQAEDICRAARVHDLGKLGANLAVLDKPSRLTDEEFKEIQVHPVKGAELVSGYKDYRNGSDLILYHHERFDGKGYPFGLKGTQIPLGARIIAVADSVDAMLSDRPYRKGLPLTAVLTELERNTGMQWDPEVVNAMIDILKAEHGETRGDRPERWRDSGGR
jgi:HD-GYP domain-containing protein (c-di-GMP phosphodiesterase class II)